MPAEKYVGKIYRAEFGLGGDNFSRLGLMIEIRGEPKDGVCGAWGTGYTRTTTAFDITLPSGHENERATECYMTMIYVCTLLQAAGVHTIDKLVGTPVECTFDGVELVGWRVLPQEGACRHST